MLGNDNTERDQIRNLEVWPAFVTILSRSVRLVNVKIDTKEFRPRMDEISWRCYISSLLPESSSMGSYTERKANVMISSGFHELASRLGHLTLEDLIASKIGWTSHLQLTYVWWCLKTVTGYHEGNPEGWDRHIWFEIYLVIVMLSSEECEMHYASN